MKQNDELTNHVIKHLKISLLIDSIIILANALSICFCIYDYNSFRSQYTFVICLNIIAIIWCLITIRQTQKELRTAQGESK